MKYYNRDLIMAEFDSGFKLVILLFVLRGETGNLKMVLQKKYDIQLQRKKMFFRN